RTGPGPLIRLEPPRKYRNWTPRRSVNYRHSPERVQARLSGRVILIFHYSTRSLLAAVRRTYGRTHRQINRPKRLRRGSCRQPTKAHDPTVSTENTRPIQPIPGGEQARVQLGHKANGANEAACSAENSRSSP